MVCKYCGCVVKDDAKFCTQCGMAIERTAEAQHLTSAPIHPRASLWTDICHTHTHPDKIKQKQKKKNPITAVTGPPEQRWHAPPCLL